MNNTPDYVIINPTGIYGQIYYHGYYYYPQYFDNSVNKYYHHYPYYNRYYDNSNSFYENKPPGFDFNINPNISRVGRESGSCLLPPSQRKADVLDYKQRNTLNILTKQQRWAQIAKGINNIGKKSWSSQTDTISTPNTSKLYLVGNTLTCIAPLGQQDISGGVTPPPPPSPPSYTETSVSIPSTIVVTPFNDINFSITSSYDMSAIFVSMYDNKIYSSYDYGLTWNTLTTMNAKWSCIASSKTGSLVVAGKYNDYIYVSTDTNHTTWESKTSSTNNKWTSVKISEKGQMIAATAHMSKIFISTDVGNTWKMCENSRAWKKIALSFDGSIIGAVVYGGYIYISYDGGNNWISREVIVNRNWVSISMSSSGLYMCAVEKGGRIYVSNNYGNVWTPVEQVRQWNDVAMSREGNIISAIDYGNGSGGKIYISKDYGATWSSFSSNRKWFCMTMSYDGSMMTNCVFNGNVYGEKYYLSLP
jgi:photosystem II stability/assembly factor-like uncharacterized protein